MAKPPSGAPNSLLEAIFGKRRVAQRTRRAKEGLAKFLLALLALLIFALATGFKSPDEQGNGDGVNSAREVRAHCDRLANLLVLGMKDPEMQLDPVARGWFYDQFLPKLTIEGFRWNCAEVRKK